MTSTVDQDRIDATSSQLARLERLQAYFPMEPRARTIKRLRAELDKLTRIEPAELEITFERDGKTHTAIVREPATPVPDALLVEHDGRTYSIAIDFGTGAFAARPVLESVLGRKTKKEG
jgi:hypothetical protein